MNITLDVLFQFFKEIENSTTECDVWKVSDRLLTVLGLGEVSYIVLAQYCNKAPLNPRWLNKVIGENVSKHKSVDLDTNVLEAIECLVLQDENDDPSEQASREDLIKTLAIALSRETTAGLHFVAVDSTKGDIGCFLFSLEQPLQNSAPEKMDLIRHVLHKIHLKLNTLHIAENVPDVSRRETDVLKQIVMGRTNFEIAQALSISPFTVQAYLKRICLKLNCNNRTSAALMAITYNLV